MGAATMWTKNRNMLITNNTCTQFAVSNHYAIDDGIFLFTLNTFNQIFYEFELNFKLVYSNFVIVCSGPVIFYGQGF